MAPADPGQLRQALQAATGGLARNLREAAGTDLRVPRSHWSIGEVGAHVVATQQLFARIASGGPNTFRAFGRPEFAAQNTLLLEQTPERDGPRLASAIEGATSELLAALDAAPDRDEFDTPLGVLDREAFVGYSVSHVLMHAHPVAMALGKPSPIVDEHARLVMPYLEAAVTFSARNLSSRLMSAVIDFRVRGLRRFNLVLSPGDAEISYALAKRVDCHVAATARAFLLISLGLQGPWGLIARGEVVAWGRRPWAALQMTSALPTP